MNKTALVTGGKGFIGSHLCELLTQSGYKVVIYDFNTYATQYIDETKLKNITSFFGDVTNFKGLAEVIDVIKNIDVVFHLAAESHVDNSIDTPNKFISTNIIGTFNVIELCRQREIPLVYISTDEVYGSIDESCYSIAWNEECNISPNSPYSASKASGDLLALSYIHTYKCDIKITRCCNNFGTGQHIEKLIPKSITTALRDKTIDIYGDGKNIRQWVHVTDHCKGILLTHLKGTPGEIYNIGNHNLLTNNEIAKLVIKATNNDVSIRYIEDRLGHDEMYHVNYNKIQKLGYKPVKSIEDPDIWHEMVQYYKKY